MPKKALYILLPLIIIVLFIVFVLYILTSKVPDSTQSFSNNNTISTSRVTKYNAFKPLEGQPAKPITSNGLPDWQQSTNIKRITNNVSTTDTNNAISSEQNLLPEANDSLPVSQTDPEPTFFSDLLAWLPNNTSGTPKTTKQRTPLEQEIYEYGNKIGQLLQDFSNKTGNQPKLMSNFVQDTSNTTNIQALEQLAQEYKTLATNIAAVQAPAPLSKTANNLSAEYANVGDATLSLSKQRTDEELLQEIYRYNAVVEGFATSFIKFSKIFRLYGISYNKGEPGDIFMPPVY